MKTLLTLIAAVLGVDAAHAAERRYTLSAFDKVRVEGDVAVEITSGAPPFALASGDPRALEALSVKVQGGTLYIRRARRNATTELRNNAASPDQLPLVRVSARAVSALAVLGHGSARIDRLAGARPSATMDGNGSVEIGNVNAQAVAINVNGSGSLAIAGSAASARAVMLGDGLIEGGGLTLGSLEFIGEGPVRGRFAVDDAARIAVKGDADVRITGNPTCNVRQSGENVIQCGDGPRR